MPPVLRMPKSPIKASVVRHDEHCKEKEHRAALDPDCPICQFPIGKKSPEGVKEGYSVMPCSHVFGSVCIKTYLAITEKPQCPICRTNLFHHCSHPMHPALYDHKKARLSPAETAAKAFPGEFGTLDCKYCRNRKLALIKRRRRREILDAARSASGSSSASLSASAGSAASGTTAEGSEEGGVGAKATRKIKTLHHGDLDSDQSSISSSSSSSSNNDSEHEDDGGNYDDDDGGPVADDIPIADSSTSPPQSALRSGLPPVPGPYGHWDLANKDRDWKFLSWYNDQDPKINPPREHYS
ncbi:unnamed protein product [Discula destructiva]